MADILTADFEIIRGIAFTLDFVADVDLSGQTVRFNLRKPDKTLPSFSVEAGGAATDKGSNFVAQAITINGVTASGYTLTITDEETLLFKDDQLNWWISIGDAAGNVDRYGHGKIRIVNP